MTKFKASLLHLMASAVALAIIFLLIQQVWYPGKLFTFAAGADLLCLIIGVDLVIGPLIMLIIFDPKKKYIKLDVMIVLLCQLIFMGYGLWTMFSVRPVYFVFVENHFYLVKADEIDNSNINLIDHPKFSHLPVSGPMYVGTKEPDDVKLRNDLLFAGLTGKGIQNYPTYFVPYEQVVNQVIKEGKTSQNLSVDIETKQRVIEYEHKHVSHPVLFLPLVNKRTPLVVVIDAQSGKVIALI